jgi:hypothetical protein
MFHEYFLDHYRSALTVHSLFLLAITLFVVADIAFAAVLASVHFVKPLFSYLQPHDNDFCKRVLVLGGMFRLLYRILQRCMFCSLFRRHKFLFFLR